TPLTTPLVCSKQSLSRVTQAAFGQRRKMLRQSLKTLGKDPSALLSLAEIRETKRAEEISIADFVKLANLYAQE
ncbi:MAG: 16S rRNA (adenine(1518)-N(6)/adenine(1519)-N(6))-dimethyltransferase, partial [Methylocystis sp.]